VTEEPALRSESAFAAMMGTYASMQAIVAATGLVRNKVIALRLGPSAFGEVAQLGAVVASVVAIVTFGMQVSLSRNVARATTQEERQAYLSNANGLVLAFSLVATVGMLVFLGDGQLLTAVGLDASPELAVAAALFLATIPLLALQTNYLSFLAGLLDVKGLARQRSLAVLLATAISVPVVWIFGIIGAAATFVILNGLLALLLGLRCRAIGYRWLAFRFDRSVIVVLAGFGLVSMVSGFAQSFADTAVRAALLKQYGSDVAGLLQAPLVLAGTLQSIVLGSIGTISLATISGAQSHEETRIAMDRLLNVAVPLSAVALGLLGLLGVPVLVLLYSQSFTDSAYLFPWILSADLVIAFTWVVGAPLLASGDRALWLALELIYAGSRWAVSVALLPAYGAVAVGMGLLVAGLLHAALNIAAIQARYRIRVRSRHLLGLGVGAALIVALAIIGANWTDSIGALVGGLVLWLVYTAYTLRTVPIVSRLRAAVLRG
jgi:PST family polysaccharide transporter